MTPRPRHGRFGNFETPSVFPVAVPTRLQAKRWTSCTASTTAPNNRRIGLAPRTNSSSAQTTSAPLPTASRAEVRDASKAPIHPTTTAISHTASAGFGHCAMPDHPCSALHHGAENIRAVGVTESLSGGVDTTRTLKRREPAADASASWVQVLCARLANTYRWSEPVPRARRVRRV